MTVIAKTVDEQIAELKRQIRELQNRNPLNKASFSGTIRFEDGATILAGEVTILENGIELPWGAGRQSLRTILDAIDNRAQLARDRADSAHDRIDTVSTRATNALNRADSAHNRIDTVSTRATNALNRADDAYNRASDARTRAINAQSRADSAWNLANGRVTQAQRNALVARMNMIIAAMEVRSGYQRPPAMS